MFEIIKADDMFELIEVCDYMAFFRRTNYPVFDPLGDNWGGQGFNRGYWKEIQHVDRKVKILEKFVPKAVRERIPNPIKKWLLNFF